MYFFKNLRIMWVVDVDSCGIWGYNGSKCNTNKALMRYILRRNSQNDEE